MQVLGGEMFRLTIPPAVKVPCIDILRRVKDVGDTYDEYQRPKEGNRSFWISKSNYGKNVSKPPRSPNHKQETTQRGNSC